MLEVIEGTVAEIERTLDVISGRVGKAANRTRIEFYLPLHLLVEPVHNWKVLRDAFKELRTQGVV